LRDQWRRQPETARIAYFHSEKGRADFTIPLDDPADKSHVISFSGENGHRTQENLYVLAIDRMLVKSKERPKVDGLPVPAVQLSSGLCRQVGNFAAGTAAVRSRKQDAERKKAFALSKRSRRQTRHRSARRRRCENRNRARARAPSCKPAPSRPFTLYGPSRRDWRDRRSAGAGILPETSLAEAVNQIACRAITLLDLPGVAHRFSPGSAKRSGAASRPAAHPLINSPPRIRATP
jgi:hypothetical protein